MVFDNQVLNTIHYNHCEIYSGFTDVMNIILNYVYKLQLGNSSTMRRQDNLFVSEKVNRREFKILVELGDVTAVSWILNARIFSASFYDHVSSARLLGMPREIETQVGNALIVKVFPEVYFKIGEELWIQNTFPEKIRNISLIF